MRGGLERWKRGVGSQGVRQALGYAFDGTCDAHLDCRSGVMGLASYSGDGDVVRFAVTDGSIETNRLDAGELEAWLNGDDPATGEHRGRHLDSPDADLVLDGTINAPKSFSLAALIDDDLAVEFEALQDRLRTRIILTWQRELNARRGAGGRIREALHRVEVVELQHRRSRALDPHIHRHLWLNVKVQGHDGQWSNVDSRVAMKLHTVINAEGELAARTDPEWIAALARHGYTLNEDGEITQLAHLVRQLSRRSTQIEANKATHLARWRTEHPGQEPSHDVLNRIDRWAWAADRPNKPHDLDEASWEDLTRDELSALDPTAVQPRAAIESAPVPLADLDRDLLAACAIVDADRRATGTGGRFSRYDILAGAMRAVAGSGVVADRAILQELIDDVAGRALRDTVSVLQDEADVPAHIKHLMSARTAALKLDLAARFDELNRPGVDIPRDAIKRLSAAVLDDVELDQGQAEAAAVIGGTHRLVTVIGPAGSGKTTMLRVAHSALARQHRRMVVVAPTKKAATVAGREIGTEASSLHALLVDHGWRYGTDAAGEEVWTRLNIGDIDPSTVMIYSGPAQYPLAPGDRIVVDESGMVDLNTANALAQVAADTGAGIAMVGDDLQARPVGHSGAMACMARRSGRVVELSAVHRFHDRDYAALTLRMRQPAGAAGAAAVATELAHTGHIRRVDSEDAARDVMVDAYFEHARAGRRVALVTATNAEADSVSEAIQQKRIELGQVRLDRVALGLGDQRILVGDVVQTRRNDRASAVENRAIWTVTGIDSKAVRLVSTTDSVDVRIVTRDYVSEHVHLAYAATVHGIQGETTDSAVVGPGVDAAGLYVGMTRGRDQNVAMVIAPSERDARIEIGKCLLRGSIEATIDDSTQMARSELHRAAREMLNDQPRTPWNAPASAATRPSIGGIE